MRAELTAPAAGSSPLARGLRGHGPARDEFGRIIPACAGFTQGHRADAPGPPDHPRLRGVYKVFGVGPDLRVGSSPLARGLPGVRAAGSAVARIIPACAGFTPRWIGGPRHERDHPRLRGVYGGIQRTWSSAWGSSPLARGLREREEYEEGGFGIIPARAGFTTHWTRRSGPTWDHPRSRGVYPVMSMRRTASSGSSPLARGLLSVTPATVRVTVDHPRSRGVYYPSCVFATHPCRIIPARAGFTSSRRSPTPPGWDHPRSRGVYRLVRAPLKASRGSSPLARGLQSPFEIKYDLRRIIPARAGFTLNPRFLMTVQRDHPRSRGVYTIPPGLIGLSPGSSPLARGLPLGHDDRLPGLRIIPARAGFTGVGRARWCRAGDHPRSRGVYAGA